MLVAAAVCPHPPLLVPEMAGEAAPELDGVRAACDEAVRRLAASQADATLVVGGGADARDHGPEAAGSLSPYGLRLKIGDGEPVLPLSLTIGRWLLGRTGVRAMRFQTVASDAEPEECFRLGRKLAAAGERVALLVMGDGTACRTEKAPGYLDDRAEPYDAAVAQALGNADAAALADLDPGVSQELQVAGRAAWQVLAGAAGDGTFRAELLADEAPYGVGYLVASWARLA